MSFIELANNRFSVRKFKDIPVEDEKIALMLEAAQKAPTACNLQPIKIIVVKSKEALAKIKKCTECHFDAPLNFIICADTNACWKRSYDGKKSGDVDASIITSHMMLEAADLGLGTTWVMYFIPEAVKTEFGLPEGLEPIAMLPTGYAIDDCAPAKQHSINKPIDELVDFE